MSTMIMVMKSTTIAHTLNKAPINVSWFSPAFTATYEWGDTAVGPSDVNGYIMNVNPGDTVKIPAINFKTAVKAVRIPASMSG